MAATVLQKFLLSVLVLVGMTSVVTISQVTIAELTSDTDALGESGDRPHRLRTGEREELREEHRAAEDLGRAVERIREGTPDIDIEEAREMAEEKLWEAIGEDNEDFDSEETNDGSFDSSDSSDSSRRVCFRSDGTITENREECDPDQGQHFGMPPPGMHEFEGGDFEERIEKHYDFQPQARYQGPPVLDIVADALHSLSAMLREVRGTEAETAVREAISYLSQVLSEYAGSDPSPDESMQIAQEIHGRLSDLMQRVGQGGGYGMPPPRPGRVEGPPMMGGFEPDFSQILGMMDCMIRMAGQVLDAFDEFGIPVEPSARAAYKQASARYAEVRPACEKDRNACMELRSIGDLLENEMRPPMEKAMMNSERSMDVMQKVMGIVNQCGMGPPPDMPPGFDEGMKQGFKKHGAPPPWEDGMHQGYPQGMQKGFPQGMQPQYHEGYGAPQGFPQRVQQGFPQGMPRGFKGCPDPAEIERMYIEKANRMRKEMEVKGVESGYINEVIGRMKEEMFRMLEECEGDRHVEQPTYEEYPEYEKHEEYKDYKDYQDYNEIKQHPPGQRSLGEGGSAGADGCPTKEDVSWTLQKLRDEMLRYGKSPGEIEQALQYKEEQLFTEAADCASR